MRSKVEFNPNTIKRPLLALSVVVLLVIITALSSRLFSDKNPLPSYIKHQISFSVIYPKTSVASMVDQTTLKYSQSQKALSFTALYNGTDIVMTEQSAAGASSSPGLVYYQSLGLTPVAQIQTKLGLVILVNFYATGSFNPKGQNAILGDGGTLVIAHPANNLSPESWKNFFNGFRIIK